MPFDPLTAPMDEAEHPRLEAYSSMWLALATAA